MGIRMRKTAMAAGRVLAERTFILDIAPAMPGGLPAAPCTVRRRHGCMKCLLHAILCAAFEGRYPPACNALERPLSPQLRIPAASAAAQQRRRHWTGKNGFRPCAVSDAGSVNSMTQGSILAVCGSMEFALDL